MGRKLVRRYKFTCLAVSYSAPGKGLFVKGQTVTVNEDDDRLPFFREGSFKEEFLPAIEVDDGIPEMTPEEGADKGGGSGDDGEPATVDTALIEVDGIKDGAAEKLAEAGIVTVANALAVGMEGLTAVSGIGQKTAEDIMTICRAVKGE